MTIRKSQMLNLLSMKCGNQKYHSRIGVINTRVFMSKDDSNLIN